MAGKPRGKYKKRGGNKGAQTGLSRSLRTNSIHVFKRSHLLDQISNTAPAGVPTTFGKAYTFQLSDMPNYNEFVNLFDQFRIRKIKLTITPTFNSNDMNTRNESIKTIRYVIDANDASVPTTENELLEYQNSKMFMTNKQQKISFVPAVQMMSYKTAVTTAYCPKKDQWLNTTDATTPHYAIKFFFPAISVTVNTTWVIYADYYIECKNVK